MALREELQQIKDAWEGEPRNTVAAVSLSDAFVQANPALYEGYADMTIEQCVSAIDAYRAGELETEIWKMQAWIFHRFQFQNIGGTAQAQIRTSGSGE